MRRAIGRAWVSAIVGLGCTAAPPEFSETSDVTGTPSSATATGTTSGPTPDTATSAVDGTGGASTTTGGASGTTEGPSSSSSTGDASSSSTGDASSSSTGDASSSSTGDASSSSTGDASSSSTGDASSSSTGDASSSSTGDPPTCDDLFGTAPGYLLCLETADACHFNATTGGSDCNAMCGMFAAMCLDAFDNSSGCTIIEPDMDTCDTNRSTEICVCAK